MKIIKTIQSCENENFFLKWYDNQTAAAKAGFYWAAVITFLTHVIAYSNLILEEHMPHFSRVSAPAGRWFHSFANSFTFYYMNWVTGVLQVLFLSFTVFILIKAFDVQNKLHASLIAGVMVTFPVIAETNLFFHDAAPYTFAIFISTLGFYLTKTYKFGCIVGMFLIMLGLAIYQSKISVAMTASLVWLIIYIIKENPKLVDLIKYSSRYFVLIVGGLFTYFLSLRVLNLEIGRMGQLSLTSLPGDIFRAYSEVHYYFFSNRFVIDNRFLTFSYWFIAVLGLALLILILYRKKTTTPTNIAVCFFLVILMPPAGNFSRILDTGSIDAITMVTYALTFFLLMPILLYENFEVNTYGLKKCLAVVLIFIIGYYISFSNIIYLHGQVLSERTMHLANRLTIRIEPLLKYSNNQVFIVGSLYGNPLYPTTHVLRAFTPRTMRLNRHFGVNNVITGSTITRNWLVNVIRYRMGVNIQHAGNNARRQYLLNRAINYGMPVYPQEGSVAIIDDTVVVILNFLGQITVNNFTATINHTGKATDLEFEYHWYLYKNGTRQDRIGYYSTINFEATDPGTYQLRVFVRLNESNIFNLRSEYLEVQ